MIKDSIEKIMQIKESSSVMSSWSRNVMGSIDSRTDFEKKLNNIKSPTES